MVFTTHTMYLHLPGMQWHHSRPSIASIALHSGSTCQRSSCTLHSCYNHLPLLLVFWNVLSRPAKQGNTVKCNLTVWSKIQGTKSTIVPFVVHSIKMCTCTCNRIPQTQTKLHFWEGVFFFSNIGPPKRMFLSHFPLPLHCFISLCTSGHSPQTNQGEEHLCNSGTNWVPE